MNISVIRQQLSKEQMDKLTEQALEKGPFVVRNLTKVGSAVDVDIYYPESKENRTIQV